MSRVTAPNGQWQAEQDRRLGALEGKVDTLIQEVTQLRTQMGLLLSGGGWLGKIAAGVISGTVAGGLLLVAQRVHF